MASEVIHEQLVRGGIFLPSFSDLAGSRRVQRHQIRPAPRAADGSVDMVAWQVARREGIGASDVACLTGTEYASRGGPFSLYQTIKGKFQKDFDNEDILRFGHYAEILADLEFSHKSRGLKLTDPESAGLRWDKDPRFVVSLDRVLFLDEPGVDEAPKAHCFEDICETEQWIAVEVKNVGEYMKDDWATESIPSNYYDQVQAQLLVTGKCCALVIALFGGNRASIYTVMADPLRQALIADKVQWFLGLLDAGTPPEPNAGEVETEAVKEATRKGVKGKEIEPTEAIVEHALTLLDAKDTVEAETRTIGAMQNALRLDMGEAAKCVHPMFTVLYQVKNATPLVKIDQEAADVDPAVIEAKAEIDRANAALKKAEKDFEVAAKALEGALAPYTTSTPQTTRALVVKRNTKD